MNDLVWLPKSFNRAKTDNFTNALKNRAKSLFEETGWKFEVGDKCRVAFQLKDPDHRDYLLI